MLRGHAARMKAGRTAYYWAVPAVLFAGDALAWGLYTHVYFAQLLVWAVPLLDPALHRAVRRFPHRLMAGACLPDLALVGATARTHAFDDSHRWITAHALLTRRMTTNRAPAPSARSATCGSTSSRTTISFPPTNTCGGTSRC